MAEYLSLSRMWSMSIGGASLDGILIPNTVYNYSDNVPPHISSVLVGGAATLTSAKIDELYNEHSGEVLTSWSPSPVIIISQDVDNYYLSSYVNVLGQGRSIGFFQEVHVYQGSNVTTSIIGAGSIPSTNVYLTPCNMRGYLTFVLTQPNGYIVATPNSPVYEIPSDLEIVESDDIDKWEQLPKNDSLVKNKTYSIGLRYYIATTYRDTYNISFEMDHPTHVDVNGSSIQITDNFNRDELTITVTSNIYPDITLTKTYNVISQEPPYEQGGNSGSGGGGGSYGEGEGGDGAVASPNGSAVTDTSHTGIYTMYGVDIPILSQIGSALFSSSFLESLIMELNKIIYGSPIDATISLMAFPFSLPVSGSETVRYGAGDLTIWQSEDDIMVPGKTIQARTIPSSMQINWGSISISEFWGNFLDYAPHTKIELYLPWGGGVCQIDPSDVMGGSIGIVTNVDLTKGTCVHNVYGNNKNIGSFGGNCGHPLPLSALDTSGKALGIVASGIALAATAGFSGAAQSAGIVAGMNWRPPSGTNMSWPERIVAQEAAIARAETPYRAMQRGAAGVASASALAAARSPVQFPRSGSFGTNSAGLGIQIPYLLISRPIQNYPVGYGRLYGYPSNITRTLGSLSGYTEVAAIHLDGIVCTEDERNEIYELLRGGVIL